MVPNPDNFCGGAFDDWLEVNLTDRCDGSCSWCIERPGFHPEHHATVGELVEAIRGYGATNVILLGGEPTMYRDLRALVHGIRDEHRVYITTNGTNMRPPFIAANLDGIAGINLSVHDWRLLRNRDITGIDLRQHDIDCAVVECRRRAIAVRLNCNVIRGHVDSRANIMCYLRWAKERGIWGVRFSELKGDARLFVSLCRIMRGRHGLNENPFIEGCNREAEIDGVHVGFRQMCGLQTPCRKVPVDPVAPHDKKVLYYDGKLYDGWQTSQRR